MTKLKQFSDKINNSKFTLPLLLCGIVCLLFVAEFFAKSALVISILLLIIVANMSCYLNFTNCLCLLFFLSAFIGLAEDNIEPNWFICLFGIVVLFVAIKTLISIIKRELKIKWLPLIISIILILWGLWGFNIENINNFLSNSLTIIFLYLCFILSNQIDVRKIIKYYFLGLIVSICISLICFCVPATTNLVIDLHKHRYMAFTGNPNTLQILLTIALSLIIYLFFSKKGNIYLLSVLSVFFIVVGLSTESKAFLLCLIILCLIIFIMSIVKYKEKGVYFSLGFFFCGILLCFMFRAQISQIIERLSKYNYDNLMDAILTGRWSIWKTYLDTWDNSIFTILFGCGITTVSPILKGTHSVYIYLLYYYGILGCLCVVGLAISYLMSVNNKKLRIKSENLIPIGIFLIISFEETILTNCWSLILMLCTKLIFNTDTKTVKNKDYSNISRLKFVKFKDILSIFGLILVFIPAMITKIFVRDLWLICEDKNEARDNGYWLFKYIREKQPQQKVAYAINKKSPDYQKVKDLGKIISYGSLSHWFWYLVADKNISSQKGGKPNAAVCYLFEVVFKLRKSNRVFLQHGIIINNVKFLHYEVTYLRLFVATTIPEHKYITNNFGYPKGYVKLLGLPRFDNLNNEILDKKIILLMPTWRQWISKGVETQSIEGSVNFQDTTYYKKWSEFLESEKLQDILRKYNKKLLFYPHRNMQNYLKYFNINCENIEICDWKNNDIQEVLKKASLLITDYSSVFFDFVYMKKPVIFYQFDKEDFRKHQYEEGYFDYENNEISEWSDNLSGVLDILETNIKYDFRIKNEKGCEKYFKYLDNKNCERNYLAIKEICKRKNK